MVAATICSDFGAKKKVESVTVSIYLPWSDGTGSQIFQFVVIHTVKGFSVVNKAEVDVFLEFSYSFYDPKDVNLISGSSAFSKSSLDIWKFSVHVLLKPHLDNFEHYSASLWNECNYVVVWTFFGISHLWDRNENWPSPVLWLFAEFSKFAGILSVAILQHHLLTWNSSTGIPSTPLALFIVMLPKAYLTLHSKMSGCRWVIAPSWLSGSLRPFLYTSSLYSCHFLIPSASVRSTQFLSFIVPIFAWNVPLVSIIFLKRPLVFPNLSFSSISLLVHFGRFSYPSLLFFGTLHLDKYILPFPFVSFLFSGLFKTSSDNLFALLISFSWGQFNHCFLYILQTSVHSSSGTLCIRSSPLNLFVTSTV